MALSQLMTLSLPIKISLEIARLAGVIDQQVQTMMAVRDALIKQYHVKVTVGENPKQPRFLILGEISEEEKDKALAEFGSKMDELSNTQGDDIDNTIHLPSDIESVKPEILKPLLGFMEFEE